MRRMDRMEAGKYFYTTDIYEPEEVRSEVGSKQTTYKYLVTTKAGIIYNKGSRAVVGESEIFYDTTLTFIFRAYAPITENSRIKYDGDFYRVVSLEKRQDYNDIQVIAEKVNE